MAKHLIHTNSSVVLDGENGTSPKLPATDRIAYGEIAVNYAKGYETISLKNSDNEIITFSSDNTIKEAITESENGLKEVIKQNEKITAAALTDLNTKQTEASTDLATHAEQAGTSDEIGHVKAGDNVTIDQNGALSVDVENGVTENSTKPVTSGDVYDALTEMELVISSALNDLNTRQTEASSDLATHAEQVGTSNEIGHVKAGDNIIIDQNGAVSVDVATAITENNTKPVTAGKVYDAFKEIELIISSSLNDLNLRISLLEDENILLKQRITVLENNV